MMEAHGHVLRQDAGSCSRALGRAETAFRHTAGDELPAWLTYFERGLERQQVPDAPWPPPGFLFHFPGPLPQLRPHRG
jgi:hypothetical protein